MIPRPFFVREGAHHLAKKQSCGLSSTMLHSQLWAERLLVAGGRVAGQECLANDARRACAIQSYTEAVRRLVGGTDWSRAEGLHLKKSSLASSPSLLH